MKHSHKIGLRSMARTQGTSKHQVRGVRVDMLPATEHAALSERFYEACRRLTDPFAAAEAIGCEVTFDSDGAPVVTW